MVKTKKYNKWGARYWSDFGERLGATIGATILGTFGTDQLVTTVDWDKLWPVIGTVGLVTAIKLLMANFTNPETGGSLLPSPPGPEIDE